MTLLNLNSFFQNLNPPQVNVSLMEQLEKPMSKEEIRTALYSMQNAKAPGPDGFSFKKNLIFEKIWR